MELALTVQILLKIPSLHTSFFLLFSIIHPCQSEDDEGGGIC
jgi:hypothetical protein